MTAAEVLRAARERISDPERWCVGAYAQTAHGSPLSDPRNDDACRWCAAGAVLAVTGADPLDEELFPNALLVLAREAEYHTGRVCADPTQAISCFNDGVSPRGATSHEDVLRLFDKAIAKAEAA